MNYNELYKMDLVAEQLGDNLNRYDDILAILKSFGWQESRWSNWLEKHSKIDPDYKVIVMGTGIFMVSDPDIPAMVSEELYRSLEEIEDAISQATKGVVA